MSSRFTDEKHFIQWNEEMAHKYDPEAYHLRSNFLIRWIERRRVNTILHFLQAKERDRVLEVGCGAGNILEQISPGQLYGIDLSTFLLGKSRRRLAGRQAGLTHSNAEHLPFASGQFQKLVCSEVLEHVANPRQVVAEMVRVASGNAMLVISVPNEAWIERVKVIIRTLGFGRWLLQGKQDAYSSPAHMTDEWHLHSFDLALLQEIAAGSLHAHQIKAVPFRLLPLRYVACYHLANNKNQ